MILCVFRGGLNYCTSFFDNDFEELAGESLYIDTVCFHTN